jgi:glutathione S-transferase
MISIKDVHHDNSRCALTSAQSPGLTGALMTDIVFHHYKESPYAEKIRSLLGYKNLSWRSVTVPRIAPKPDLSALTGGYRKVPVLQLGADVFCDTRLIAQEIEALAPSPAAHDVPGSFASLVENWVDINLFGRAVSFTFGSLADMLPDELLADRAALRGGPLERGALKAAVPLAAQELSLQMAWVEQALTGRNFVNGSAPSGGDFTLYSTLWFLGNGGFDFKPFPQVGAWLQRMKGFGRGQFSDMSADEALALARNSTPRALPLDAVKPDATGLLAGQRVSIAPEMLGHGTSVEGELVALSAERVTVKVSNAQCGVVHVHFPRLGYRVRAVKAAA